jgi:23S rRNA (adenine1618-N6)-methyltransferase
MTQGKQPQQKTELHPRNINRGAYDLPALIVAVPLLSQYITPNKFGQDSIDFSNPVAVKLLNQALLHHYYGITHWQFPDANLCPPIPGRADYIHYMADLLMQSNFGRLPAGNKITCMDVGTGASCIYPILGVAAYGWNFIGTDIDATSLASAEKIVSANKSLKNKIQLRLQNNPKFIFSGIITPQDKIDVTVCNPPFHASAEDAIKGTQRKVKNLSGKKTATPVLNFAGVSNELIYEGGELAFILTMVKESKPVAKNCVWFTTLVSKQSNLKGIYKALEKANARQVKTIEMGTGNKSARVVAWTFLSDEEQKQWRSTRWKV